MSRVLVVEDDVVVAKVFERVLELENHEFVVAGDVPEARAALDAGTFDVILLDLMLPRGHGLELLSHLRNDLRSSTPVIVVSAMKHEGNLVQALDAGANDYVTKPFSPTELLARIRKWVQGRESVARAR